MKEHEITLERDLVPRAEPGELEKSADAGRLGVVIGAGRTRVPSRHCVLPGPY
jgi:hypothetical protein